MKASHSRFWKIMGERFGSRWFLDMGANPTPAWTDLLDRYTAEQLSQAVELLKGRAENQRGHPPRLPEFEILLERARKSAPGDGVDHVRNHWRSVVAQTAMRHAALLRLVPWGTAELGKLPSDVYRIVLRHCQELLDWACDEERRLHGQRTASMAQHINSALWNLMKPWQRDEVPAPQTTIDTNTNTEVHV